MAKKKTQAKQTAKAQTPPAASQPEISAAPANGAETTAVTAPPAVVASRRSWLVGLGLGLRAIATSFGSVAFARVYMAFSVAALLATTLVWALLGAHLHLGNADQLVNSYLFEGGSTLKGAIWPGQHTFLLKWPLFWLIKGAHFQASAFTVATVGVVLVSVLALAWVIYRIERRPLVFGTICLALATALLLVPAQPYAGALLPVNMAMLTTRNVEYVLYIAALVLFVRSPRVRSGTFWVAVAGMSLLIASDKLFLSIGVGAALVALFVYTLARRWDLAGFSANWLLGMLASGVGAVALLAAVAASGTTNIAGQSTAGPYGFVHSPHGFVLGAVYAGLSFLTNLGANPAFDARTLGATPHIAWAHLTSWGGVAYLVALAVAAAGVAAAISLLRGSVGKSQSAEESADAPSRLSLMMIWTTCAAAGAFIVSNHYYVVDARYLAIGLFTVFICVATVGRKVQLAPKRLLALGAVTLVALALSVVVSVRNYHDDAAALGTVNHRNQLIARALAQHKVRVLLGDYWRVIPSRLASHDALRVLPLETCTQARQILSSKAWQPDIKNHGFAYLVSFDQKLTDYPSCSLEQVVKQYGRPNASSLIAGTLEKPKELLLFYDQGSLHSAPKAPTPARGPSTVVPIDLEDMPNSTCTTVSTLNVVAHEDDDLLFMNPDIQHEIRAGHCVRTVYITAGDAGSGSFYWLGRQQGAQAAYSSMIGDSTIWVQRIVKLTGGQYITVANPRGNTKVSLIFMNLPDGNLRGEGFRSSSYEGLARLESGQVQEMQSVDGQSRYNSDQLVAGLAELMHQYQPAVIRTQSNYPGHVYPDHSDHMAVGRYTQAAYHRYETEQFENTVSIPILYYIGYPIHERAVNVTDGDLAAKTAAFAAYAQYDNAVCITQRPCRFAPVFEAYLGREYTNEQ